MVHFSLCCAQNGIISPFSSCRCQCLLCLTLVSKSLLVSASKPTHPRFIVYLRVCSFYNEIYISKSSLAQTNMLLKGSFQNISEWGKLGLFTIHVQFNYFGRKVICHLGYKLLWKHSVNFLERGSHV